MYIYLHTFVSHTTYELRVARTLIVCNAVVRNASVFQAYVFNSLNSILQYLISTLL